MVSQFQKRLSILLKIQWLVFANMIMSLFIPKNMVVHAESDSEIYAEPGSQEEQYAADNDMMLTSSNI